MSRSLWLALFLLVTSFGSLGAQMGVVRTVTPRDTVASVDISNNFFTTYLPDSNVIKLDNIPESYKLRWDLMKKCTGLAKGTLADWTFYIVSAENFAVHPWTFPVIGFTFSNPEKRIYVIKARETEGTTVSHEMVHALLHENGMNMNHVPETDRILRHCNVL